MNIVNMIAGAATPMIASKVAGMFGVPESAARKILSVAVPVLLAAFAKRSASAGGTDAIGAALGGLGRNPLDALSGGDAAQTTAAANTGTDLLASILGGGGAGTLASKLGSYAGVDAKAAGPVLGLAGAMTLGGLKKTADDQGLDTAGIMRMLDGQKAEIAAAIPTDFARTLSGTDLVGAQYLPAAAPAAPPRPTVTKAPPPPEPKRGMMRWLLPLIVVAVLAWLASQFFGRPTEEPVADAPVAEPAPVAETTEPAAPAATEAAANPLLIDGVDIGASVQDLLAQVTGTLSGVTDATSAQAALGQLTEADAALAGIQGQVGALSAEGKSALATIVSSALPAIQAAADSLLADSAIGPVLKPAIDSVLAKLTALAA